MSPVAQVELNVAVKNCPTVAQRAPCKMGSRGVIWTLLLIGAGICVLSQPTAGRHHRVCQKCVEVPSLHLKHCNRPERCSNTCFVAKTKTMMGTVARVSGCASSLSQYKRREARPGCRPQRLRKRDLVMEKCPWWASILYHSFPRVLRTFTCFCKSNRCNRHYPPREGLEPATTTTAPPDTTRQPLTKPVPTPQPTESTRQSTVRPPPSTPRVTPSDAPRHTPEVVTPDTSREPEEVTQPPKVISDRTPVPTVVVTQSPTQPRLTTTKPSIKPATPSSRPPRVEIGGTNEVGDLRRIEGDVDDVVSEQESDSGNKLIFGTATVAGVVMLVLVMLLVFFHKQILCCRKQEKKAIKIETSQRQINLSIGSEDVKRLSLVSDKQNNDVKIVDDS